MTSLQSIAKASGHHGPRSALQRSLSSLFSLACSISLSSFFLPYLSPLSLAFLQCLASPTIVSSHSFPPPPSQQDCSLSVAFDAARHQARVVAAGAASAGRAPSVCAAGLAAAGTAQIRARAARGAGLPAAPRRRRGSRRRAAGDAARADGQRVVAYARGLLCFPRGTDCQPRGGIGQARPPGHPGGRTRGADGSSVRPGCGQGALRHCRHHLPLCHWSAGDASSARAQSRVRVIARTHRHRALSPCVLHCLRFAVFYAHSCTHHAPAAAAAAVSPCSLTHLSSPALLCVSAGVHTPPAARPDGWRRCVGRCLDRVDARSLHCPLGLRALCRCRVLLCVCVSLSLSLALALGLLLSLLLSLSLSLPPLSLSLSLIRNFACCAWRIRSIPTSIHLYLYACTYAHMHLYLYACTYTHAYLCIHLYLYACTYTHMHLYLYACTYTHAYLCIHLYLYACTYTHAYLCIHLYLYACTYTHAYL